MGKIAPFMTDKLTTLNALLTEDPGDPFVLYAIAQEYVRLDDTENARSFFRQLHDTHPEYVALYYHWGRLEEGTGNVDEALKLYAEGMQVAQTLQDFHTRSELQSAREHLEETLNAGQ